METNYFNKQYITVVIAILLTIFIAFVPVHSNSNVPFQFIVTKTLFFDDFEGNSVGYLPSGWVVHWGGETYGVSTEHSYSGDKSLKLKGRYGWSCVLGRPFSSEARFIGFEAMLYITDPQTTDCPMKGCPDAIVGLGCKECIVRWGDNWILLYFNFSDGYLYVRDYTVDPENMHFTKLIPFQKYTWIKIKVILDRDNALYYIWVNDNLIVSGVPVIDYHEYNKKTYLIDRFIAQSGWGGETVFLDDVKVFEASIYEPASTVTVTSLLTSYVTLTNTVTLTKTTTLTYFKTKSFTYSTTYTTTVTHYTQNTTEYLTSTITLTNTITKVSTYTLTKVESKISSEAIIISLIIVGFTVFASVAVLRKGG